MPSWLCFSGRQVVGKGGGKAIGLAIGAGTTDHLDVWQGIGIDKQACTLVFGCRSRCFCIIFCTSIMFISLYLGCTWALVILFHFGCNGDEFRRTGHGTSGFPWRGPLPGKPREIEKLSSRLGVQVAMSSITVPVSFYVSHSMEDDDGYRCTLSGEYSQTEFAPIISLSGSSYFRELRAGLYFKVWQISDVFEQKKPIVYPVFKNLTLIFIWCCSVWLWPLLRGSDPQCFV